MIAEIHCPECLSTIDGEFIRCPVCRAVILDRQPWQDRNQLVILIVSLLLCLGGFVILHNADVPGEAFISDPISLTILAVAVYGLVLLVFKRRAGIMQEQGFRTVQRVCSEYPGIDADTLDAARVQLTADTGSQQGYNGIIAYQRLKWLTQITHADGPDSLPAVLEAISQHADSDRDALERSFSRVHFLIWFLPSTGFLGTVFGMSRALMHFADVLKNSSELALTEGLRRTISDLGVAFHTTLVGLLTVIPVLAVATVIRSRNEALQDDLDRFFLRLAVLPLSNGEAAAAINAQDSMEYADVGDDDPDATAITAEVGAGPDTSMGLDGDAGLDSDDPGSQAASAP